MPAAVRSQGLREAQSRILSRQGLITPFATPLEAVRAMVAVQTQYAASLPVAVAARIKRGSPGWEDEALTVGGSLIKSWSVRHTLHAHLPEDHTLLLGVVGDRAYARYLRWMKTQRGLDATTLEIKVEDALRDGPLTRDGLHERVPELAAIDMVGWGLDVMGLAFRRRLCVVGRGSNQSFALLEPTEGTANTTGLIRRYLTAYGPATMADFSYWSGLPTAAFRKAWDEDETIEKVLVEGLKGDRYVIRGTFDGADGESLGVRLLAKFDPLVLAHKDKGLFIRPEDRTKVFRKAGQVEAVVLSEGVACATWRLERKAKTADFVIEPMRPLNKRETARIEKEAAAMAKKLGTKLGRIGTL